MSRNLKLLSLTAIALLMLSTVQAKELVTKRRYTLPGHGALELSVPTAWKDEVRHTLYDLPPTIALHPAEGDDFVVMITPLWNLGTVKDFNSDKRVKEVVDADRQEIAPGAVEAELVLERIEGHHAHGYYFIATDKAPKPGGWECALRGGVGTGELLVSVTVLTHEKDSEGIKEAIAVFSSLRQVH